MFDTWHGVSFYLSISMPPRVTLPDEAEVVARIRRGDVEAFAKLFRAYYPPLVRFLRARSSWDSAEDIAQEVFERLWRRRMNLDPSRSIQAYLFTAARHLLSHEIRHDRVVRAHEERTLTTLGPVPESSPEALPDDLAIAAELQDLTASHIDTLPPRLRDIYLLSREGELTPVQIAETLGISVSTVYVLYGRLLRALHPVLQRWIQE